MEILTQKINNKFGEKYSYLKLYEVVFDKQKKFVEIVFLYPENISAISEEAKKELTEFIKNNLNLNSEIHLKFKNSSHKYQLLDSKVWYNFSLKKVI